MTGGGSNRFNLLGCIDPFTLELISTHSMMYVIADQTKAFLEKVREVSGSIPLSVVLDNARYQHCRAVMEK
ncbi:MAG: IS630 family transposase, partial [Muribaculaceae bacterium]|nr:IS630 family transposase [Muribaculaceae bacterium]